MSVSINKVYQKVLAIANKEQRGYITPQEFNLFSDQAQKEIFEQYFYDINQFNRVPGNQTEFSDQLYMLEEKIAPFRINDVSMKSGTELLDDSEFSDGTFSAWTLTDVGATREVVANANNGYVSSLRIASDSAAEANPGVKQNVTVVDGSYVAEIKVSYATDSGAGRYARVRIYFKSTTGEVSAEKTIAVESNKTYTLEWDNFYATTGSFQIELEEEANNDAEAHFSSISLKAVDNSTLADDIYRLGEVMYTHSGNTYPITVTEVNANEVTTYNLSPLARPTTKNPVYVRSSAAAITIYPSVLNGSVKYNYVKLPEVPKWTYNVVLGKAVYNSQASDAKDFELHDSEENNLVYKILQLAGISMGRADIVQAATSKEVQEIQQQKS